MSDSMPLNCPLLRGLCTNGIVSMNGHDYYCAFYLDETCYVFDALKSISASSEELYRVVNGSAQMEVHVIGSVDTYEQN